MRKPRLAESAVGGGAARTLHGTLPWRNRDHETRRLLYRYCPKHVNFHGGTFQFECVRIPLFFECVWWHNCATMN